MIQRDSLAKLTLDTLPFNIAVLDDRGTILFTNRAWREFGDAAEGDMIGVSYFEGVDESADEHAADALAGIRAVIDGEQDVFTLEYPCHTPDRRQWFLMRAARMPDHEEGHVVVAHIDITQRKLAELRARDRQRELERVMGRIEGLVRTVMEATLQADSREEIERTLCRQLVAVDPYLCAWIGRVDLQTGTITPVAREGEQTASLETTIPQDSDDPTAMAIRTGETQIRKAGADTALHPVDEQLLARPAGDGPASETEWKLSRREITLAAFPLEYGETRYGVLTVYGEGADAFDDREVAVLEVLASVASTAINAIESRRILTSDRIVELELSMSDEPIFVSEIAAELDCTLVYEGSIYHSDGTVTMLFVVQGADRDAVVDHAETRENVKEVTHVSENDDQNVFEFRVDEQPLIEGLADHGIETTAIDAHSQEVRVTLELPPSADVRTVVERLATEYPSTELVARHEHERRDRTRQELLADIEAKLTDRQRLALEKAFLGGFFEWPREVSGEELAESMGITSSTYHQHLRGAERKLISELFEE